MPLSSRKDSKRLFDGDLVVAAVGLAIVVIGSAIAAGGIQGRRPYPSVPEPTLGKVLVVRLAVVLLGLILAVTNVTIYLIAKRRNRRDP